MASKIIDKAQSVIGHLTNKNHNTTTVAGHKVGNIGYGLMGLTWRATPPPQEQAFSAMREALAQGANFWNGGEIYGSAARNSLHLLMEYFEKYPEDKDKVVVSIKGGCLPDQLMPDGGAENTRRSIQECVDVLGKAGKKLDVWEPARVSPWTPIEITMRAAKEFVDAGKLGGVSLSECSAESIRRASKVVKIVAVEVEFSLWATEILDNGVAQTCAELDIPIVAYSPLGRGFLTGEIKKPEDIPEGDFRRTIPRFRPENFDKNLQLVHQIERIAKEKKVKPGQIAMSWILAKSGKNGLPTIIPIPGATTPERVKENTQTIELSDNDVKEIDSLLESVTIEGGRYDEHQAAVLFGNSPPLEE
jgi:pyridoxine 4-dehydrogenase